jgi:hypothetical protein
MIKYLSEILKQKTDKRKNVCKSDLSKIIESYNATDPESLATASNVSYVIRCSLSEYIVYLDVDNEYGWETTDEFDKSFSEAEKSERNKIIADIEQQQHTPAVNYLNKNAKKSYYRLLGECCLYALTKNFSVAENRLEYTKRYIEDRTVEISRKWQIRYCLLILLIVLAISVNVYLNAEAISSWLSIDVNTIMQARFFAFGAMGTTLSVISKNGRQTFNCESGRMLNFLEILSKMVTTGIYCFIIILLFSLDFVFTGLENVHGDEVLYLACILSGFSERLVPSILQKIELRGTNDTQKNEA